MAGGKDFAEIGRLVGQRCPPGSAGLVTRCWRVGAYLSQHLGSRAWGDKTMEQLADYLRQRNLVRRGFDRRGLYRMRQFYEAYAPLATELPVGHAPNSDLPTDPLVSQPTAPARMPAVLTPLLVAVSWSHHIEILNKATRPDERLHYLRLVVREQYSVRELRRHLAGAPYAPATLVTLSEAACA